MNLRRLRPAIVNRDAHEHIAGRGLGVFHKDVKVAVIVEDARVEQFKFRLLLAAPRIFLHELCVGKFALRIFVEIFQVRMRRRGVEVIINFLHVFAVIAFGVVQTEEPFLENRIAPVPHSQTETKPTLIIAETGDAIFAPAIGATARVVVWKIIPRCATGRIVFAHRAPLAFREVWPPRMPAFFALIVGGQPAFFSS